jgi:hypothetical protein
MGSYRCPYPFFRILMSAIGVYIPLTTLERVRFIPSQSLQSEEVCAKSP